MSDVTPIFGFPFQEGTDPADGPAATQALAERAEEVAAAGIRSSGKSIIPAAQTRTDTAFGELGTPDRVEDIVLPTDGLIFVLFHGIWKAGPAGAAGRAAIFLNSDQLKVGSENGDAAAQETLLGVSGDQWSRIFSAYNGLYGNGGQTASEPADVTTGQVVGANTYTAVTPIFAAAGTYDVSVRFKSTSTNTVTVKNRKLWVWSQAFGMPPA